MYVLFCKRRIAGSLYGLARYWSTFNFKLNGTAIKLLKQDTHFQ